MAPLNHFRYHWLWLTVAVAGLILVAAFNLLIDPIGAFPRLHNHSLEPYRPVRTAASPKPN